MTNSIPPRVTKCPVTNCDANWPIVTITCNGRHDYRNGVQLARRGDLHDGCIGQARLSGYFSGHVVVSNVGGNR